MKSTIFSLAFLLAPAAVLAQTETTTADSSSSTCQADYIVETCLSTTEATQADCGQQDYSCQCAAYQAIVTLVLTACTIGPYASSLPHDPIGS